MDTNDKYQGEAAKGRKRDWDSNPSNVFAFHASKVIKEANPSITATEMMKEVHRRWENVADDQKAASKKRNMGELMFNSTRLKAQTASGTLAHGTLASATITSGTVASGMKAPYSYTLSNHFD